MPKPETTSSGNARNRTVDPGRTTVHQAMREFSGAEEVFRRFGIDTCCGGELPLAEAAAAHDVDLEQLLDALEGTGAEG